MDRQVALIDVRMTAPTCSLSEHKRHGSVLPSDTHEVIVHTNFHDYIDYPCKPSTGGRGGGSIICDNDDLSNSAGNQEFDRRTLINDSGQENRRIGLDWDPRQTVDGTPWPRLLTPVNTQFGSKLCHCWVNVWDVDPAMTQLWPDLSCYSPPPPPSTTSRLP